MQHLSTVAPLGTLLAVIVGYVSYRGTIRQKTLADNRNARCSRVQWATAAALEQMQDSQLANSPDQVLPATMAAEVVEETIESLDSEETSLPWVGPESKD